MSSFFAAFIPGTTHKWWRGLTVGDIRADLMAGLLGALLVLPQGVAFAQLAGMPPVYGIYSAIVPCIVAALLGSSRHVMTGPTNANSLALFAMLSPLAVAGSPEYIGLVLTTTFMVGVLQVLIARFRLGALANFISPSVLLGFMAGAACLIAYHALLHMRSLVFSTQGFNLLELAVGALVIVVTVLVARWRKRWPAMLLGLLAAYIAAAAGSALTGLTLAQLGVFPSVIPPISIPELSADRFSQLFGIALALTLVAVGQSISIAKAVAERSGQSIDADREFFGQGMSNVVGSFFSSYLSCGSLNRSMPNFEAGARTPLAAVFASLLVLALAGLSAGMLERLPLVAIDALLLYVAWTLINVPRIREIIRFSRQEAICMASTWAATMLIPLELAILLGVGVSLLFYLHQTARPLVRAMMLHGPDRRFVPLSEIGHTVLECPQLKLVRMEGEVYFGAAQHVEHQLKEYRRMYPGQKHLLIMARSMNSVDLAAVRLWWRELQIRRQTGGDLYLHRPRTRVLEALQRIGMLEELTEQNIFPTKDKALNTIVPRLDPDICLTCTARVFRECASRPGGSAESLVDR
ncbi:MAG: SulP family inorganic anion transporter [Burkholderiaceae bacterium]|nr:SulP family inorganic anion transporter [Burkholderiaceae bacterium]